MRTALPPSRRQGRTAAGWRGVGRAGRAAAGAPRRQPGQRSAARPCGSWPDLLGRWQSWHPQSYCPTPPNQVGTLASVPSQRVYVAVGTRPLASFPSGCGIWLVMVSVLSRPLQPHPQLTPKTQGQKAFCSDLLSCRRPALGRAGS